MADYESVLCVKNQVHVYKIPPRTTNRGYRAADWKLDEPDWTGRLRIVSKGKDLFIKLEDKNSGELFAQCPVDKYPGIAVEPVTDSSRYFVLQIKNEGRSAFIGIGFEDRGDSFDLNVSLQDHFKWLRNEEAAEKNATNFDSGPKLDLGFKEGQTIKINIGQNKRDSTTKSRPRAQSGGGSVGILPPPPGGVGIVPPPPGAGGMKLPAPSVSQQKTEQNKDNNSSNVDFLFDFDAPPPPSSTNSAEPVLQPQQPDPWGDFTGSGDNTGWVQF